MSADLDKAIDRAVREMLDIEPPADLRERVIAELSAAGSRLPASSFRLPALITALGAAAVVVLAVMLAARREPLPQAPVVAHATDRHLPADVAPAPPARRDDSRPARPATPRTPEPPPPVVVRTVQPAPGVIVAVDYWDDDGVATTTIAPLKTMAPIAVAPIAQDRIAPTDIAVRPLTRITELQIAPLTPPDRR